MGGREECRGLHKHVFNDGQYAHVSAMVAEIGKLLGGWIRQNKAM